MYTRMSRRKKIITRLLVIWLVLLMVLVAFHTEAHAESATIFGYNINYPGGNKISAGWSTGNSGPTFAEGEWVAYQMVINEPEGLSGAGGYYFRYDVCSSDGTTRFADLIHGFQVTWSTDTYDSQLYKSVWLTDDDQGYPQLEGEPTITSIPIMEEAQNYTAVNPYGTDLWTDFKRLDIPYDNINIKESVFDSGAWQTPVAMDPYDEKGSTLITNEVLDAADVPDDATVVVIYFQIHLARTSLWSSGLYQGFGESSFDAYNWGGWVYGESSFDDGFGDPLLFYGANHYSSDSPSHVILPGATQAVPIPAAEQPIGSLSGYKWDDTIDPNGIWDDGELPLIDWPIFISADIDGMNFVLGTITNDSGFYAFPALTYGMRYITEANDRLPTGNG